MRAGDDIIGIAATSWTGGKRNLFSANVNTKQRPKCYGDTSRIEILCGVEWVYSFNDPKISEGNFSLTIT